MRCRLVYVIAGAGYGKTQAVRHHIENRPDALVRWLQLTESDNIGSRLWENLTHCVAADNPDLASKMRGLGFPDSFPKFRHFAALQKNYEHKTRKIFFVMDDFHLIHSAQALRFTERCANLQIPGLCMIIISRKEPAINVISLLSKGNVSIITEDSLRFTEEETAAFLKGCGIRPSAENLSRYSESTNGWAFALRLLSMVLKRTPDNPDLALDTMKQNIFKLLEAEAFAHLPKKTQNTMIKLALVSNLPLTRIHGLFGDDSFLRNAPQLASFMWYDSFSGDYRIHPLYMEFLQSKHGLLSKGEKNDTYRLAAAWCLENNFYLDAMNFFSKSHDHRRMLGIFSSYPFRLPHDISEYFLNILEEMVPSDLEEECPAFLTLKNIYIPLLLTGLGKYDEAKERTFAVIKKWEADGSPTALTILYASYSNLAYIDMYTCSVTHIYNAPYYLRKSIDYYKLIPQPPPKTTGPSNVADVRSYACLVGADAGLEEFDAFLYASRQIAVLISETPSDLYSGYDDLVAAELAFFKNQPDEARKCAYNAILNARKNGQYSIDVMASQYLLRIALSKGDYSLTGEILGQFSAELNNPNFWNRQLLYDLITGFFYAQVGLPNMVPKWLIMDEKDRDSHVHIPTRELLVGVKCFIAMKKYNQALTVLCNAYPREPQERFLFGELNFSLLTAVARHKTGDTAGAMADLGSAYRLSFSGVFEFPFIELGKNMRPLVNAALEWPGLDIPPEWLKTIGRKASVYAKKVDFIAKEFKKANRISDPIRLSEREHEVLTDLCHGLSREEIAASRYLSVNTIHKIVQSLYIKLNVNSNVEAVRMAMEKKLI